MKPSNPWSRAVAVAIVVVLLTVQCAAFAAVRVSSVKMNKTSATITIFANESLGKTYQLKASVSPSRATNKVLTWYSSSPAVADVDSNGLVTSYGYGTATITAKATDGSNKKATCKIKVVASSITIITGISLDVHEVNLYHSPDSAFTHNYQLSATISPWNATKQTLKWSSSKTKVAKVSSSGYVTATGEGTAIITAAALDGSGRKDTCTITVKRVPITEVYTIYIEPEADKVFNALSVSLESKDDAITAFDTASQALSKLTTTCSHYAALKKKALSYVKSMVSDCSNAKKRLKKISSANDSTLLNYQHRIVGTLKNFKTYVTSLS